MEISIAFRDHKKKSLPHGERRLMKQKYSKLNLSKMTGLGKVCIQFDETQSACGWGAPMKKLSQQFMCTISLHCTLMSLNPFVASLSWTARLRVWKPETAWEMVQLILLYFNHGSLAWYISEKSPVESLDAKFSPQNDCYINPPFLTDSRFKDCLLSEIWTNWRWILFQGMSVIWESPLVFNSWTSKFTVMFKFSSMMPSIEMRILDAIWMIAVQHL